MLDFLFSPREEKVIMGFDFIKAFVEKTDNDRAKFLDNLDNFEQDLIATLKPFSSREGLVEFKFNALKLLALDDEIISRIVFIREDALAELLNQEFSRNDTICIRAVVACVGDSINLAANKKVPEIKILNVSEVVKSGSEIGSSAKTVKVMPYEGKLSSIEYVMRYPSLIYTDYKEVLTKKDKSLMEVVILVYDGNLLESAIGAWGAGLPSDEIKRRKVIVKAYVLM